MLAKIIDISVVLAILLVAWVVGNGFADMLTSLDKHNKYATVSASEDITLAGKQIMRFKDLTAGEWRVISVLSREENTAIVSQKSDTGRLVMATGLPDHLLLVGEEFFSSGFTKNE